MKERGYEHRIINHKDSKISHSIGKKSEITNENTQIINDNNRKSKRLSKKEKVDYKELNQGKKIIINAGSSEVAEHMQKNEHDERIDIEYKIIGTEANWLKRGIKEAIEIRRKKPTLNSDEGRYYLSQIWTKTIQDQIKNPLQSTMHSGSRNIPTTDC